MRGGWRLDRSFGKEWVAAVFTPESRLVQYRTKAQAVKAARRAARQEGKFAAAENLSTGRVEAL